MKYKIAVCVVIGVLIVVQVITSVNVITMKNDIGDMQAKIQYVDYRVDGVQVVNRYAELGKYYSEDEIWWYKVQCALTDPKMVRVSLADDETFTKFTVNETIYVKDYDDLILDTGDDEKVFHWVSGGLLNGAILSLPAGTYEHYKNSGIMYVTQSDIDSIYYDPIERYYKRLRYVIESPPDEEVVFEGEITRYQEVKELDIPDAVISFSTGGHGFIAANLYLKDEYDWRTVNGMGPGIYNPGNEYFAYSGNLYMTPLNMVPIPDDYESGIHIVMNANGKVYFKIHYVPDWW